MRIISKFHDYYDLGQAQGIDMDCVFLREQSTISMDKTSQRTWPELYKIANTLPRGQDTIYSSREWVAVSPILILFAGRLYPLAQVTVFNKTPVSVNKTICCYSWLDLINTLKVHDCTNLVTKENAFYSKSMSWSQFFELKATSVETELAINKVAVGALWVDNRYQHKLNINCPLAPYQFFKALDSWQAYQEISMFIANLASPEVKTIEIADKYRIEQHGFDKWSFRKRRQ